MTIAHVWCHDCGCYHQRLATPEIAAACKTEVSSALADAIDRMVLPDCEPLAPEANGSADIRAAIAGPFMPVETALAMAGWLPAPGEAPALFGVDRSTDPHRLAGLPTGELVTYRPPPVAEWLSDALLWPLAMHAGAEHWRRRTGGTVSWDHGADGRGATVTWRAGTWSHTAWIHWTDELGPSDETGEEHVTALDYATLEWVDAGCPR